MKTSPAARAAELIAKATDRLPSSTALEALRRAFDRTLQRAIRAAGATSGTRGINLQPRAGMRSKIDRHPEMKAYIDDLPTYLTISELARELRGRFGEIAPGRSAVHRYLQRQAGSRDR